MISTDPRLQSFAEHVQAWLLVRKELDAQLTAALYDLGPLTPRKQLELIDALLGLHASGTISGGCIRLLEERIRLFEQPRVRVRPQLVPSEELP